MTPMGFSTATGVLACILVMLNMSGYKFGLRVVLRLLQPFVWQVYL